MVDRKKLSGRSWIAIACLLLFVVYPLSMGPAWWCAARLGGQVQAEPLSVWMNAYFTFYAPLHLLVRFGPSPVQAIAIRYVESWDPLKPQPPGPK